MRNDKNDEFEVAENDSVNSTDDDMRWMKSCTLMATALCVGLAALIFALGFLVRSCKDEPTPTVTKTETSSAKPKESKITAVIQPVAPPPPLAPDPVGMEFGELTKTSIPMSFYWKEKNAIIDEEMSGGGSTCVYYLSKNRDYLLLVTNYHCLGLDDLFRADSADGSDEPEILTYNIFVEFPGKKVMKASRFKVMITDGVDLAVIYVSSKGLREGIDYVKAMPMPYGVACEIGDEVVAVGAPMGLSGTHTFGRISAIRDEPLPGGGKLFRHIQTDAAINPGNSGGPLFLKRDDRYLWIGINTWRVEEGSQNLGFAIAQQEVAGLWTASYSADAGGARALYRKLTSSP